MKQMVKNWKQLEDLEDKIIGTKDGNIQIGKNLEVDGKTILNSSDDLVDKDGNKLIRKSDLIIFDVAIVPESLLTATEYRTATNEEKEWILNHINYFCFDIGYTFLLMNMPKIGTSGTLSITAFYPRFTTSAISAGKYWKLTYNQNDEEVKIEIN